MRYVDTLTTLWWQIKSLWKLKNTKQLCTYKTSKKLVNCIEIASNISDCKRWKDKIE